MRIGARLRTTRIALGYNDANLYALSAAIEPFLYAQYESGAVALPLEAAQRLCAAHGLTLDWVFAGNPSALDLSLHAAITTRMSD